MSPRKKKGFDKRKEVKAIARERVGTVKSSRVIVEKPLRPKPKHKKKAWENDEDLP